ncbi:hypothetical protein [Polymorphospora rubra]|uniref:hypothetical protein n=1 Tax=Polymorphospora rubra TaxID=338584 RepID=UPI0033F8FEA4
MLADLRDGKATVLTAHVRQAAAAAQVQVIGRLHGNVDLVEVAPEQLREILTEASCRRGY